jgi:hypothetical protein
MEERKDEPLISHSNSTDSLVNVNNDGDQISSYGPSSSSAPLPVALPPTGRRIALFQASSSHDDENQSSSTKRSNGNEMLPAEIILLRREKKISIAIPKFTPDPSLRIHRVYLSSKKYLHLYHEIIGGIYGISSRPELEIHHFQYYYRYNPPPLQNSSQVSPPSSAPPSTSIPGHLPPSARTLTSTSSSALVSTTSATVSTSVSNPTLSPGNKLISLELVYDPILNLYVITHHIEDKLILYLSQLPSTPSIQYAPLLSSVNRIGSQEFNTLTLEKQKQWRKFLAHFIRPLLNVSTKGGRDGLGLGSGDVSDSGAASSERVERAEKYLIRCLEFPETEGTVTPEDSDGDDRSNASDDSDSDDEKGRKKKKRKGKKKGGATSKASSKKAGAGGGSGGGTSSTKASTKTLKSKEREREVK